MEQAFFHVIVPSKMRMQGMIRYHPQLVRDLVENRISASTIPRLLPMIVPPRPWTNQSSGGYLTHSNLQPLVRINGNRQLGKLLRTADEEGHLHTVFHALDVLGATPWRINKAVLQIVTVCWNEGKEWPCLPVLESVPDIEKPSDYDTNPKSKSAYWAKKYKRENKEKARYSQRCDSNYKILLAKAVFYLLI